MPITNDKFTLYHDCDAVDAKREGEDEENIHGKSFCGRVEDFLDRWIKFSF